MKNLSDKELELLISDDVYTYEINISTNEEKTDIVQLELKENMEYETLTAIAVKIADVVVSGNQYRPEFKKPLFLFYILDNLTNYKPLPNADKMDFNKLFKLLKSPIGKKIEELTNEIPTLRELDELINDKIEFKKAEILHNSSMDQLFNSLSDLLITFNEKISVFDMDTIGKVLTKLNLQKIAENKEI